MSSNHPAGQAYSERLVFDQVKTMITSKVRLGKPHGITILHSEGNTILHSAGMSGSVDVFETLLAVAMKYAVSSNARVFEALLALPVGDTSSNKVRSVSPQFFVT